MNLKSSNILWLCDHTVSDVPAGGAEITDSHILRAGESLGYSIRTRTPNRIGSKDLAWSDLVVFSNNFEFPRSVRKRIMSTKPYVAYSHDSGRWLSILEKQPDFFKKSIANVFLSPLHKDQFHLFLEGVDNTICIPPYIPQYFMDMGYNRNGKVMYAGNIHDGKGIDAILRFARNNPENVIDFYFHRHSGNLLREIKRTPNCNPIGYVSKEAIHEKYNEYSYFIHLPKCFEAFGRAVSEAYLCGCNIIINDRVGAFSFGWDYKELRLNTLYSNISFWDRLSDIVK